MKEIDHKSVLLISIIVWLLVVFLFLDTGSILGAVLIHVVSMGYLIGIYFWGRSNRGNHNKVTFWNKTTPEKGTISDGLKRGWNLGLGVYAFIFIPIVLSSNYLPYSGLNAYYRNLERIQKKSIKSLDLKYQLGEPVYIDQLDYSSTDSTKTIEYRASGKYEKGIVSVTVNNEDSIIKMNFKMENQ